MCTILILMHSEKPLLYTILTVLHSERPKLCTTLAFLNAVELKQGTAHACVHVGLLFFERTQ